MQLRSNTGVTEHEQTVPAQYIENLALHNHDSKHKHLRGDQTCKVTIILIL